MKVHFVFACLLEKSSVCLCVCRKYERLAAAELFWSVSKFLCCFISFSKHSYLLIPHTVCKTRGFAVFCITHTLYIDCD